MLSSLRDQLIGIQWIIIIVLGAAFMVMRLKFHAMRRLWENREKMDKAVEAMEKVRNSEIDDLWNNDVSLAEYKAKLDKIFGETK